MADEATETAAAPAPKKSAGLVPKIVNALGFFILSFGAVVAGGFVNAKLHPAPDMKLGADGKITPIVPPPHESGGHDAASETIYYAIDPPMVVNFEESSAVRFLQVTIEVSSHNQKVIEGVQKHTPVIRNNLLLRMSNRDFRTLMSREGKETLRQECLAEVRAILKKEGVPPIDDLLFTSFVVQ
jgi:flagellar protein FliL